MLLGSVSKSILMDITCLYLGQRDETKNRRTDRFTSSSFQVISCPDGEARTYTVHANNETVEYSRVSSILDFGFTTFTEFARPVNSNTLSNIDATRRRSVQLHKDRELKCDRSTICHQQTNQHASSLYTSLTFVARAFGIRLPVAA